MTPNLTLSPTVRAAQPFLIQLADLLQMQLANWRWSWRSTLLTSLIAPLLSTLALGSFVTDQRSLGYILTGNLVLSLLFSNIGRVSSNMAYMRATGMLDYFASLPIQRTALVLATVLAFLILGLPALFLTLVLGVLCLHIPVQLSPWIILVVPLCGITLCGLGALIGLLGRTMEEVGSYSQLVTFVLLGLGPVIIPPERLSPLINHVALFSPATYAASAMRYVILGQSDHLSLIVDILVLCVVTVGLLWIVTRRLDWRQR